MFIIQIPSWNFYFILQYVLLIAISNRILNVSINKNKTLFKFRYQNYVLNFNLLYILSKYILIITSRPFYREKKLGDVFLYGLVWEHWTFSRHNKKHLLHTFPTHPNLCAIFFLWSVMSLMTANKILQKISRIFKISIKHLYTLQWNFDHYIDL